MTAATESVASVLQERVRADLRDKRPDRRLRRTAEQLATPPSVQHMGRQSGDNTSCISSLITPAPSVETPRLTRARSQAAQWRYLGHVQGRGSLATTTLSP